MDKKTIAIYDQQAAEIAARHRSWEPTTLYRLIQAYFTPGLPTADVGCGSGRDSRYLADHGFAVTGFDASAGMLAEARAAYPDLAFKKSCLPELREIENSTFNNALCAATLMHLPEKSIELAVVNLLRILRKKGRLIVSVCPPRENDERLFSAIEVENLKKLFALHRGVTLHSEISADPQREEIIWHNLVIEAE